MLLIAGDHVPEIPLSEIRGSAGIDAPEQYVNAVTDANVGVTWLVMLIVSWAVVTHSPFDGVNV
jgi:hypothetical protein